MTDPLGRPGVRPSFTETRGPRVLTEDQIDTIANDVRTKPLAEVGRHVMPLISHIVETEGRCCSGCRHWVAYNSADSLATRGECLLHAGDASPVAVQAIGDNAKGVAVLTPFDWQCKGWQERPRQSANEAQVKL